MSRRPSRRDSDGRATWRHASPTISRVLSIRWREVASRSRLGLALTIGISSTSTNEFLRADARLRVAQDAAPPHWAPHWFAYGGGEAALLAIVLLKIAGGFAYAGKRLRGQEASRPECVTRVTAGSRGLWFVSAAWADIC